MTDSPRNGELDLAIIGGGAAGVLVAIQVLRQARAPLALAIFEPASQLAQGIAQHLDRHQHSGRTTTDDRQVQFAITR